MFTLLLLSLLHTTTSTVYTVTPDHPNITCHHCHNLQHYLLNTTKYFTSNTQLLFLPGIHHLHSNLTIQNAHKISLIGNATQDVVIQCEMGTVSVFMINITNLAISNLIIQNCYSYIAKKYRNYKSQQSTYLYAIKFKDCNFVSVDGLQVREHFHKAGILGINILGDSYFNNIRIREMKLLYLPEEHLVGECSTITISNPSSLSKLKFLVSSDSCKVVLRLSNITAVKDSFYAFHGNDLRSSEVFITNSTFHSFKFPRYAVQHYFYSSRNATVQFEYCRFESSGSVIQDALIKTVSKITLKIMHCNFIINNSPILLLTYRKNDDDLMLTKVTLQNTVISFSTLKYKLQKQYIIKVSHTQLLLTGTVIFHNNTVLKSIIVLTNKSELVVDGNLQFINNTALSIIDFQHNSHEYIMINESSAVDISQNYLCSLFSITTLRKTIPYPYIVSFSISALIVTIAAPIINKEGFILTFIITTLITVGVGQTVHKT